MYTTEEYKRRVKALGPVAREIAAEKTPDEAREIISKMNAEDAYIIGMWLGKMLVLDELTNAITCVVVTKAGGTIPIVQNFN